MFVKIGIFWLKSTIINSECFPNAAVEMLFDNSCWCWEHLDQTLAFWWFFTSSEVNSISLHIGFWRAVYIRSRKGQFLSGLYMDIFSTRIGWQDRITWFLSHLFERGTSEVVPWPLTLCIIMCRIVFKTPLCCYDPGNHTLRSSFRFHIITFTIHLLISFLTDLKTFPARTQNR